MDAILTNTKAWVSGLAEARSVLDIVFIRGITKNEPTFRYTVGELDNGARFRHRLVCSPRRASARTRSRRLSVRACGPRMIGSLRAFRPSLGAIRSASYSRAPAAGSRCRASSSPRSRSRGARRRSRAGSRSPDGSACPRRRSGNGRIARGSEASSTAIDRLQQKRGRPASGQTSLEAAATLLSGHARRSREGGGDTTLASQPPGRHAGMESAAAHPSLFNATDATTTPRMTVSAGMMLL